MTVNAQCSSTKNYVDEYIHIQWPLQRNITEAFHDKLTLSYLESLWYSIKKELINDSAADGKVNFSTYICKNIIQIQKDLIKYP